MGALIAGLGLLFAAGLVGLFLVARSRTPRLPMDRRRLPDPAKASKPSQLSRITGITTEAIADFLERRGWTRKIATALDLAGVRVAPADFLVLVAVGGVVGALFGLVLGGPVLALLFLGLSPLAAKFGLGFLVGRRQKAFGDQLDNTLQLFAGSLRAGHSLLRAVDAVAKESDTPTSEELARVVNETRIGRDLDDAMELTAERMNSEDFSWVAQAIGIHREVGGDLAEVLDRVGATIRERNQIKRQVSALSAEGKMSAYILMALPVVIAGFLTIMAQEFIVKFVTTGIWGYGLMFAALVMFTIGGIWMKKVVTFRF
ncbi:type II secretion system F family protein [Kocuria sp. M1R5S2]|uniref:type II secretion system F family protein n=1 Tax=Kocuria rhizosphaerae TaxID=3376285 RepID=UPI003796BBEF